MGIKEYANTCTDLFALYPTHVGVQHIRPPVAASGEGTVHIDTVVPSMTMGSMGHSRALTNYSLRVAITVLKGRMREE